MSTLTRSSSIPYTGPAPTNRDPYVPKNVEAINARGAEIGAHLPFGAGMDALAAAWAGQTVINKVEG